MNSTHRWISSQKRSTVLSGILFGVLVAFLVTTIVLGVLYSNERNKTKGNTPTTPGNTPTTPDNTPTTPGNTPTTPVDNNEICLTPACIKAANDLLQSIDETVDPCENFFEFACGTWLRKTRIPADASSVSTSGQVRTQLNNIIIDLLSATTPNGTVELNSTLNVRRLYASCVNEDAIEAENVDVILPFVNTELGGWPILQGSTWNNSTFNFSRVLLKLAMYSSSVIFNAGTQIDQKNSSFRSIRISQNNLALGDRNYYLNDSDVTIAYRKFIRDLAIALTNDTSMVENDTADIYAFEQSIARYVWTTAEQSARGDETIRTTISNLSSAINTSFDFLGFIRDLYLLGNITLVDTDIVSVSELEYLRNVSAIINQQSPRTLQNYVVWRFMMAQTPNMPKRFQMIRQQFYQVTQGLSTQPSRLIACAESVNNIMGFAVAKLYKDIYFDSNARNQSLEMIENIRNTFIDIVNQSTWMDSVSKTRAIEKARSINEKIGYPDYIDGDNMTKLENEYAEHIYNSSYMQNQLVMLQVGMKRSLQSLRQPIDRTAWEFPPVIVNAFYNPSLNDICFPAGILQLPFFDKDVPNYLNYGGIGMVMGHEITHGFDDEGRLFDKDGNKVSWWTNETIDAFNQRKACIIQQYSNYTATQVNLQLKGEQTQGENIADNGGLKEAFFAYQKWAQTHPNVDKKLPGLSKYSAEQLFFLNFGQQWCQKGTDQNLRNQINLGVHSPSQFRVIGPTSNFAEFHRVFDCRLGQSNSPVNKCSVW